MTEEEKIKYLEKYADTVDDVPKRERAKFKELVEEGCSKDWPVALHIKAYSCYGGNSMWECDWVTSRDCLLKLTELTDNPFHYNTLGYIFYYGRCNDGIPEYEKAFQYFSVGAASGVFESMYKLSDMFLKGNGCLKSPGAAAKLVASMYSENKDIFTSGAFDGKFADVALRMGGLFERGDGVEQDIEEAYAFYLEAKLAIEKRVKDFDYYGDKKVQKNINDALARVLPLLPADYFKKYVELSSPRIIGELLTNSVGLDITIDEYKGYYRIKAKSFPGEDTSGLALINVPQLKYCELTDNVIIYMDRGSELLSDLSEMPYSAFITDILYDEENDVWNFMYRDMKLFSFKCDNFFFYSQD